MKSRRRQGEIDFGKLFMLLIVVVGAYLGYAFIPPYLAKYKMDEVVKLTVYDWRDRDLDRAMDTLVRKMDEKNIPEYIWAEDCEFYTDVTGLKHVDCLWVVEVRYPGTQKRTELEFQVHKYLLGEEVMDAE